MAKQPEDYTYLTPIYKINKREAIELAKELGDSPEDWQLRIYRDQYGKYYHN